MEKIRFPYRVKVNGAYYAPGEIIQVENANDFIRHGAELVSRGNHETHEPPKRPGRPKKT